MQALLYSLADDLFAALKGLEICLLNFYGEDSDFVRMNHNRIRQAGNVLQKNVSIELIAGKHHARSSIEISGDFELDKSMLFNQLNKLRDQIEVLPEDLHINFSTTVHSSENAHEKPIIDSQQAVEQVISAAHDLDLVGIFANGTQFSGFANSLGQRNWHSISSFNLDWSCYLDDDRQKDKAVKSNYAGFNWNDSVLHAKMEEVRSQLNVLKSPSKTIPPGHYRAYFSPSALSEIIGMMSWGGFGLKSLRTKNSPLLEMVEKDRNLHQSVSIQENYKDGLTPEFTSQGFIKPDSVTMIHQGQYKDCLVSARSASEYGETMNASSEYLESIDMSAGELPRDRVLEMLDTGLYINNLWYLNFSDRQHAQLTGMTRFACFWVENGEVVAPLNVMRFDDSVYRLLGENLLALTADRDMLIDPGTYGARSSHSIQLPGALVKDLKLTL